MRMFLISFLLTSNPLLPRYNNRNRLHMFRDKRFNLLRRFNSGLNLKLNRLQHLSQLHKLQHRQSPYL